MIVVLRCLSRSKGKSISPTPYFPVCCVFLLRVSNELWLLAGTILMIPMSYGQDFSVGDGCVPLLRLVLIAISTSGKKGYNIGWRRRRQYLNRD
ncbi:hypothetical protein CEXT_705611 [Caerostris extrusa]|uniref:Uncharacterized protein n=1 Tax=Caerostris extrusa TaxID=172846 RepID=A0AAV4MR33_CAEEX|nr:hypothetical protein CEXT_705611 [Caerostris extrusa]